MLGALRRRFTYYAIFSVLFGVGYTAIYVQLGEFPTTLLFALLGLGLLKDLVDEWRIHRGDGPVSFLWIEHTPSNLVLIAFVLAGVIDPAGSVAIPELDATVDLDVLAIALAAVDTVFDVSQDLREA